MAAAFHTDPDKSTFVYIMYIESVTLGRSEPLEAVCRWYVDKDNDCSEPRTLLPGKAVNLQHVSFMLISFEDLDKRDKSITLTISEAGGEEHLAVCFLDVGKYFSDDEHFKLCTVDLEDVNGVVCTVQLHTACQQRWSRDQPITKCCEAEFVTMESDAQAKHLHNHIVDDILYSTLIVNVIAESTDSDDLKLVCISLGGTEMASFLVAEPAKKLYRDVKPHLIAALNLDENVKPKLLLHDGTLLCLVHYKQSISDIFIN